MSQAHNYQDIKTSICYGGPQYMSKSTETIRLGVIKTTFRMLTEQLIYQQTNWYNIFHSIGELLNAWNVEVLIGLLWFHPNSDVVKEMKFEEGYHGLEIEWSAKQKWKWPLWEIIWQIKKWSNNSANTRYQAVSFPLLIQIDSNYKHKSVDCIQVLFMIGSDYTNYDKLELSSNEPSSTFCVAK